MRKKIAVFRQFVHDELEKLGVPGGRADANFLRQVVANTNRLAAEKLHVPAFQESHSPGSEEALGWVEKLETDGNVLFADIEFTGKGIEKIKNKALRWISASFRNNFCLSGDRDGEVIKGPWLAHVAGLGVSLPRVKGLFDLAEVTFSDGGKAGPARFAIINPQRWEIAFFSEMPDENGGFMSEANFSASDFQRANHDMGFQQQIYAVAQKRAAGSGRTAIVEFQAMQRRANAERGGANFSEPVRFTKEDFEKQASDPKIAQRIEKEAQRRADLSGRTKAEEYRAMKAEAESR